MPERFRAMMREYRMLSYKVLWFMQDSEGFVVPAKYERLSLVVPTTHDLPTIAGFLSGDDNELRQALELFPRPEMFEEYCKRREQDVKALMTLLAQHQLCPADIGDIEQMVIAILALLAGSGSLLYAISLEDVLGLREQLNVPGTTVEYPNWRERLPLSVEEFLSHPRFQFVAALGKLANRSV